jgi:hypothetical protein
MIARRLTAIVAVSFLHAADYAATVDLTDKAGPWTHDLTLGELQNTKVT